MVWSSMEPSHDSLTASLHALLTLTSIARLWPDESGALGLAAWQSTCFRIHS